MRIYGPLKKQKRRASVIEGPLKKKKKMILCTLLITNVDSTRKHIGGCGRTSAKPQVPSTPSSRDIILRSSSAIGTASDGLHVALSKAHDVLTIKKQIELKRRREQARLALIEIEKSVVIEDNWKSMQELERLCGCQVGIGGIPLDWLGLRRKDDNDDIGTAGALHSSDSLLVTLSKARDVVTIRKQIDLKRKREQARLALIEIEKSVVLEDNLESMKELEELCGCQVDIGGFPLDWLGLRSIDDGEDEEINSL